MRRSVRGGNSIRTSQTKRKQQTHIAYHTSWSQETILTSWVSLASTLYTQGLFYPIAGAA